MRIALQPDLPKVDVEPSVAVVEESSPDAVADPVKEEQAPTTPVPPVTVVQVGQVSSRGGCLPSLVVRVVQSPGNLYVMNILH